jgi:predicted nucleic-acid-binding Zn-ribbon protein
MVDIKEKDLRWCPRCGGKLDETYEIKAPKSYMMGIPKAVGKECQRCGWEVKL